MTVVRQEPHQNDKVYVCGFDQYADHNFYVTEAHLMDLADAFVCAVPMLQKHDKVSMVSPEDYSVLEHDYATLSKYAINIWKGADA